MEAPSEMRGFSFCVTLREGKGVVNGKASRQGCSSISNQNCKYA